MIRYFSVSVGIFALLVAFAVAQDKQPAKKKQPEPAQDAPKDDAKARPQESARQG